MPKHKTPPAPRPADLDSTPVVGAAAAIALTRQRSGGDLTNQKATRIYNTIQERVEAAQAGDLSFLDEVLVSQIHAANTLANQLMQDAALENRAKLKIEYLRLAMQAQAQTIKCCNALNELHNPKRSALFVKQLNQQNNLHLEASPDASMDGRAQIEAGPGYSTMEALAQVNRSEVR